MNKPELIAPAGDLEKLKIAFQYGADAVYASTPLFSMRTREIGFDYNTLEEGITYAHQQNKRLYITLNVYPHANEIVALKKHISCLIKLKPDAFIVADPGIINYLKEHTDIPLHLSTQANATNQLAIDFWRKQGIERVVLARELSLKEIKIIADYLSAQNNINNNLSLRQAQGEQANNMTLEAFVHGSMCMAYSGRCQISNYLTGRDPNRGACIQACRYNYSFREGSIEEELRPGENFPIQEDRRGTYILNSKDLCMIEHLDKMIDAGVTSFKIEGRLKSVYYVAMVTKAYRQAIDTYFENKSGYLENSNVWREELEKVSNRGYTTGFYFHRPNSETNNYLSAKPAAKWGYIGLVTSYDSNKKQMIVEAKNHLLSDSDCEIVTPTETFALKPALLKDGKPISEAHANMLIEIPFDQTVPKHSFLRHRVLSY